MRLMLRVRFHANHDDPRPINFPVKHPYWITGYAGDGSYATVVSYADDLDYITENWPEASNINGEVRSEYTFTSRFPIPDWFKEEE